MIDPKTWEEINMSWLPAFLELRQWNETLQSLNGFDPGVQGDFDRTSRLFTKRGYDFARSADTRLHEGLKLVSSNLSETVKALTEHYPSLRGFCQVKVKKEIELCFKRIESCSALGLKNLVETHPSTRQPAEAIKRFQTTHPVQLEEPRPVAGTDLESLVADLKAADETTEPLLKKEVRVWVRETGFFQAQSKESDEAVQYLLDYHLGHLLMKIDRLFETICVSNAGKNEAEREALKGKVEAINATFGAAKRLYEPHISEEKQTQIQTAFLIAGGDVVDTMTMTSLSSQEKACEVVGRYAETVATLMGIRASPYGVQVDEQLIIDCIADRNRKKDLNHEVVATACNYFGVGTSEAEGFKWKRFAFDAEGVLIEGQLHSPASGSTTGLNHFWSKGLCSTSSLIQTDIEAGPSEVGVAFSEANALYDHLIAKGGEGPFPLVIQLDNFWTHGSEIEKMGRFLAHCKFSETPVVNIPLVYSQFWDASAEHNVIGLARLGAHILQQLGVDVSQLKEHIRTTTDHKIKKNIQTLNTSLKILINEVQLPEEDLQEAHLHLMALKTLVTGTPSPLTRLELHIVMGVAWGSPTHVFDNNGLDNGGIGRAAWEGLSRVKKVENLSTQELYDLVNYLANHETEMQSLFEKAMQQCHPLESLDQNHDYLTEKGGPSFANALQRELDSITDPAQRALKRRAVCYFAAFTKSFLKTKGIIDATGTGVVGAKLGHDRSWLEGKLFSNPWAGKRLLPGLDTLKGDVIRILKAFKYTSAGLDIVHRLSQKRENAFKPPILNE